MTIELEEYKRRGICDSELIFLDYRFTIPNFPSRLLSYMQAKLPVLACTDPNTYIEMLLKKADLVSNVEVMMWKLSLGELRR